MLSTVVVNSLKIDLVMVLGGILGAIHFEGRQVNWGGNQFFLSGGPIGHRTSLCIMTMRMLGLSVVKMLPGWELLNWERSERADSNPPVPKYSLAHLDQDDDQRVKRHGFD